MFKLPKNFEMKGRTIPYFYNEEWITNGHFIIKRSLIKDSAKYCWNIQDINQPEIDRVLYFSEESLIIEKTDRLYDFGNLCRIFLDEQGNEYLINELYVKHFNLSKLYAINDTSIIYNQEKTFAIMPMTNKNCEAKRKCA